MNIEIPTWLPMIVYAFGSLVLIPTGVLLVGGLLNLVNPCFIMLVGWMGAGRSAWTRILAAALSGIACLVLVYFLWTPFNFWGMIVSAAVVALYLGFYYWKEKTLWGSYLWVFPLVAVLLKFLIH